MDATTFRSHGAVQRYLRAYGCLGVIIFPRTQITLSYAGKIQAEGETIIYTIRKQLFSMSISVQTEQHDVKDTIPMQFRVWSLVRRTLGHKA